jgi:DNA-directed RNA polymerase subunit RPC12/RpoP
MRQNSSNPSFSFSGIVCSTFGHDYLITRKVTNHIKEYRCSHCGKEVTNNFSGSLENLTTKNKRINSTLALFFEKKMKRYYAAS